MGGHEGVANMGVADWRLSREEIFRGTRGDRYKGPRRTRPLSIEATRDSCQDGLGGSASLRSDYGLIRARLVGLRDRKRTFAWPRDDKHQNSPIDADELQATAKLPSPTLTTSSPSFLPSHCLPPLITTPSFLP